MDLLPSLATLVSNMPRHAKNQRTMSALEKLIHNIDRIPVEEIEKLVEKFNQF